MKQNGQLPSNEWKGGFFNKYESVKAIRELKKYYPFLKEVDSISLQKAVENLSDAYTRYYKKQNDVPRFKSKKKKFNLTPQNTRTVRLPWLAILLNSRNSGWFDFPKVVKWKGKSYLPQLEETQVVNTLSPSVQKWRFNLSPKPTVRSVSIWV
ncbi:hypothetical protein BACCIP111895_04132 [Neobacillus rhizosphaerae]|uniref:Transposase n=1 Tax=Neobacillus rhizosphaerae TaxID=2880965 RepID=A0ABN8KWD9_9BACI|nr:hypothetical protein BACCIP111895_04132 [Neobacillus rhizosphaerae]